MSVLEATVDRLDRDMNGNGHEGMKVLLLSFLAKEEERQDLVKDALKISNRRLMRIIALLGLFLALVQVGIEVRHEVKSGDLHTPKVFGAKP